MMLCARLLLCFLILCYSREYRSFNGKGNNLQNPDWGSYGHTQSNLIMKGEVAFDDGIITMPVRPNAPSPRAISSKLAQVNYHGHAVGTGFLNELHTYTGQLIAIDTAHTSAIRGGPFAVFIDYSVPTGDLWLDQKSTGNATISFPRSLPAPGTGTGTTPVQVMNEETSWLDLSSLYGLTTIDDVNWDNTTGKLVWKRTFAIPELVYHQPASPGWHEAAKGGEFRINKTPPLLAWAELFKREHNRLVDQFSFTHPEYTPLEKFQEARRMVIATFQAVAAREYLASTVGRPLDPYTGYDPTVDPNLDVFFSSVAFRYGHSAVSTQFPRMDMNLKPIHQGEVLVRDCLYQPWTWEVYDENDDPYQPHLNSFLGCFHSLAKEVDGGFVDDVRNLMFMESNDGEDLFSYNIFRGRDHGLPDYNRARVILGLPAHTHFENITSVKRVSAALKELYNNDLSSVDPYVGGICEDHVEGGTVGPLFAAVILAQFEAFRKGDRFWFENPDMFTEDEIAIIYGRKLKNLLQDNFEIENPESIPESAFYVPERQLPTALDANNAVFYSEVTPDLLGDDFYTQTGLPSNATWATRDLAPTYRLNWHIIYDSDNKPKDIIFVIQAATNGWVGLGFHPNNNTMKGADIMYCQPLDIPICTDRTALDVGIPVIDVENGGTSDIKHYIIVGNRGIINAAFMRPIESVDVNDKNITDNMRIIFAFHPTTAEEAYHGPTRSATAILSPMAEFQKALPPPGPTEVTASFGLQVFALVISIICIIIAIIFIIIIAAKSKHFHYQTPFFCFIILIGTILGYTSVLVIGIPEQSKVTCHLNYWLIGISFPLIFGALFAKVYRIWRILGQKQLQKVTTIKEVEVLPFIAVLLIIEVIYLLVWTFVDKPDYQRVTLTRDTFAMICTSKNNTVFWIVFIVYKMIFLIFGVFLAWQTRQFPKVLNESKPLAISIYTISLIVLIMIPLGFALSSFPVVIIILKIFGITISYMAITFILFGASFLAVLRGKDPKVLESIASVNYVKKSTGPSKTSHISTRST